MSSKRRKHTRNQCMSWWRYEWKDPIDNRYWSTFSVSVMAPTYVNPRAVIIVSLANAVGKVSCRMTSIEGVLRIVNVSPDAIPRLSEAFERSKLEAIALRQKMMDAARSSDAVSDGITEGMDSMSVWDGLLSEISDLP